ncbi:hypothetical protein R9C00_21730 [Flammeovirgaceae bacterium SG7u.111]|nr:hypothetical protein [Flammeovirgaceae bacterium SG7u.132]WPO34323.1 hypothetical protein R9C00_21730 [Flammeovirgaceae bacterium SG7u.111]
MAQHTSARVGNQSDEKVRSLVKAFLKQRKTAATKHEIVTETGLSVYDVEDALEDFIGTYQCVLKADADHNLSYKFDFSDVVGKKDFWKEAKKLGKKLAKWVFMGFITFMLFYNALVYFPYLVGIGPTLYWSFVKGIVPVILALFIYAILYDYTSLFDNISILDKIKKFFLGKREYIFSFNKFRPNLFRTVFEFVFGEKTNQVDDILAVEKRVLQYVLSNNKRLTVSELIMITGWDSLKADKEITLFMHHYQGNIEVSDKGVLIYHFPNLSAEDASLPSNKTEQLFIWNNLLEIKEWNKNFMFENTVIIVINLFICITSGILLTLPEAEEYLIFSIINIHILPFIFTLSFFFASITNKIKFQKERAHKIKKNRYFLYLKQIFSNPEKVAFEEKNHLQDTATNDLEAIYHNTPDGAIHLSFQTIIDELSTVDSLEKIKKKASLPLLSESTNSKRGYEKLGKRIYKKSSPDELTFVFKKRVEIETYFRILFFLVMTTVIIYGISTTSTPFFLYFPILIFFLQGFFRNLQTFIAATKLTINNKICTIKSGPIPFIGTNCTCYLWQLNSVFCKIDHGKTHQLLASTEHKSFYLPLIRRDVSRTLLWEVAIEIMEWKEEHQE